MGIIKNIKNYFNGRFDKKIMESLERQRNKLNFNPLLLTGNKTVETAEYFSKRIMEYKVWSMGNAYMLRYLYRQQAFDVYDGSKLNYFWHRAPVTRRMVHCGVPGLISTRMADILFGSGYDINAIVYKDGEGLKEDKDAEKKLNEFLDNLISEMKLQERLQTAATNESWGGHCFFKLSHDLSVSQYPILETFDITKCEVIKTRGITKAIVFKRWYEYKQTNYRLDEIYSTNADGDATIQYKLFCLDKKGEERQVDLLSISQTAEQFNVGGVGNADGVQLDENGVFTYVGLKGMLAFEKPNKTPSKEFPNSNYGASDYEGSVDSFDSLDEIYSQNIREIRTNETKRYVPETLIPTRVLKDGTIEPEEFDDFADCYVKVVGDPDQDAENKIEYQEISDKTSSYMEKWKVVLSTICNNAKISPFSLGITWLEAVNPSADSQRERNKITLDMRDGKLKLWKPFLEEMVLRILQLNTWIVKNAGAHQEAFDPVDVSWDNTSIQVTFGEYINDSTQDRINMWGGAKAQRVASTDECVKEIHPDWTAKQVSDEVNLIRFEDGMSTDTPDGLPQLTGAGDGGEDE